LNIGSSGRLENRVAIPIGDSAAGRPFVDTDLREVDQDVWIDFPWDRDPHNP
jgi:hypothetical protein